MDDLLTFSSLEDRIDDLEDALGAIGGSGYDIVLGPAGQSNACGAYTADPVVDLADSRLYEYPYYGAGIGTIIPAVDPLHHPPPVPPFGAHAGCGPAVSFGKSYVAANPNRKVLFVPMGWPGAGFESSAVEAHWKVGVTVALKENLYEKLVTMTEEALELGGPGSRLICCLWNHGENDATRTTPAIYRTDLLAMIDGLRTRLDEPRLPFLICSQAPSRIAAIAAHADIDNVQIDIPYDRENCSYCIGSPGEDGLHYTLVGVRENGRRFHEALLRARLNIKGGAPAPPTNVILNQNSVTPTTIDVSWSPAVSRVTDYTIQHRATQNAAWTTLTHTRSLRPSASITGIVAGSTIEVRVLTVNEAGVSPESNRALIVTTI